MCGAGLHDGARLPQGSILQSGADLSGSNARQAEDVVVLAAPESDPEWMLGAQVTDDGR